MKSSALTLSRTAFPGALVAHDRTLDAHLDVEEEAVVPLLLALEPDEFDRYYRSPISTLIPASGG